MSEEKFNSLKDRLIESTGSPGLTSFNPESGKVTMKLSEWERLIQAIENRIEFSPDSINIIIGALYDKKFEVERYIQSSMVPMEPSETDKCCQAHMQSYMHRKTILQSLDEQNADITKIIRTFEALLPPKPEESE